MHERKRVNPSSNISDSLDDAATPAGGRCGRHAAAGTAVGPPGGHSCLNPSNNISDSLDDAAAPAGRRCGRHAAAGTAAGPTGGHPSRRPQGMLSPFAGNVFTKTALKFAKCVILCRNFINITVSQLFLKNVVNL